MLERSTYSCTLTGASFLFFELKKVALLKQQGLEEYQIREKVRAENLFEYKVKTSIKRSLPSVLRRVNVLDDTLCNMVLEKPLETGRIINLYAIMKTDRLFFEFMNEVVREKFERNDYHLGRKDVNAFITSKAEQDETVAVWTDKTVGRLKQAYFKVLFDAGVIKDRKTGELNRVLMEQELKHHLVSIGDVSYVRAMGVWVE